MVCTGRRSDVMLLLIRTYCYLVGHRRVPGGDGGQAFRVHSHDDFVGRQLGS